MRSGGQDIGNSVWKLWTLLPRKTRQEVRRLLRLNAGTYEHIFAGGGDAVKRAVKVLRWLEKEDLR